MGNSDFIDVFKKRNSHIFFEESAEVLFEKVNIDLK